MHNSFFLTSINNTGCTWYLEYEVRLSQKINFLKNGQTNYNEILTHNRLMYKIAIYSIKLPLTSITASTQPQNFEQALTIWAFCMALNSFLISLINSFFVLHGILLADLSIALYTKKSIGFRSSEFGGQTSGRTKSTKLLLSPSCVLLDVWQGAKSCCHTYGLPAATLRIQGSTCISKTFRYSTMLTFKPLWKMYGGMT